MMRPKLSAEAREKWNAEIGGLKDTLSEWHAPAVFEAHLERVTGPIPSEVFFRLPAAHVLRDAWIIGRFASLSQASEVRLNPGQWPDGKVRYAAREIAVEATEALENGRRRGDEAWEDGRVEYDPVENWVRRAHDVIPALRRAVERKGRKRYAEPCELIVYISFSEYGIRHAEIVTGIRREQTRLRGRFAALHVLWNAELFLDNAAPTARTG